ncbi:hypothetical protein [Microbacterium sp. 179-I 3D4 NHS]|uniref:hypothetical protein n=1 Tax=Microbacterium sp. 179-I 3D4 NHS TaxID=3142381 RepID=UPI0039A1EAB6
MRRPAPIPPEWGSAFGVAQARDAGVGRGRLRHPRFERPFRGVRVLPGIDPPVDDPYERQARARLAAARAWLPRMRETQFFSHETAAAIWGAPLPLVAEEHPGFPVQASVFGEQPLPREPNVAAHRASALTTAVVARGSVRVASPASTWASLGRLPLFDLVALGDFFCREWRSGVGRRQAGRTPLATRDQLRSAIEAGRRVGNPRLRRALDLIREDSWSPRETRVRCILIREGLPEPELNVDVFDDDGRFLACLDLAYPARKAAVEYHGMLHASTYPADVERLARLRAAGWTVIEVTAPLLATPGVLAARVRDALR